MNEEEYKVRTVHVTEEEYFVVEPESIIWMAKKADRHGMKRGVLIGAAAVMLYPKVKAYVRRKLAKRKNDK